MDWITLFAAVIAASISGIMTFAVTKFKYNVTLKKDKRDRLNALLEKIYQYDEQNEQEPALSDLEYFINRFCFCDAQYNIAKPLISDKYCCELDELRVQTTIPSEGCCDPNHHSKFIDAHVNFEKTLITSIQNQLKELYA